jgi:putative ABC transport system substrate-binding protein
MKTILFNLSKVSVALLLTSFLCSCEQQSKAVTIGIIEPLEHKAMTEIVTGFSETLKKEYDKPVILDIENAQNDPNLKHAIIQKMIDQNVTIIAPIGVDATEMTLSMTKNTKIPVVSLASDLSNQERKNLHPCNVAVVHDEIEPATIIHFVHQAYPTLTHLTLIHSSANKVFPEVNEAIAAGKSEGIAIHPIMVSSLPELTTATQALPSDTQGLFVLKDSLIVSGISTLSHIATKQHIPLITSDQGSVEDGAGFALGVHEKQIGVEGAKLSAAILNGKSACDLPIAEMNHLTVFINQKAFLDSAQNLQVVKLAAEKLNYAVEFTDKTGQQ